MPMFRGAPGVRGFREVRLINHKDSWSCLAAPWVGATILRNVARPYDKFCQPNYVVLEMEIPKSIGTANVA
jgi:hypothetical protein